MNISDKTIDLSISNYGTTRNRHYDIALLPWGATEPHNLHLPYLTDAILSHDIAVDAAAKAREKFGLEAMVLPAIPLGAQNPASVNSPSAYIIATTRKEPYLQTLPLHFSIKEFAVCLSLTDMAETRLKT